MPAPPIALVTCERLPDLTADDRLLAVELARLGLPCQPAVWSSESIDWTRFSAVVIRSCWDYHLRYGEFLDWLNRLEAAEMTVWNPVALARWNAAKSYLGDLASRGVPVVPTTRLNRRAEWSLPALRDAAGSADIVVKPIVSATAWLTWRVPAGASDLPSACRDALAAHDCIVQPFVPEISAGEWSLVYFDRAFSHAVLKQPKSGEFRVQEEYGGTAHPAEPPASVLEAARVALDAVTGPVLYARVDGVETAAGFRLLELELVEPVLYLAADPAAAGRCAAALHRYLGAGDGLRPSGGLR